MTRTDIINALIAHYGHKTYLELGVQYAERHFDLITAESKDGVDANMYAKCQYHMTTDDFFAQCKKTYDIIFVDADHRTLPALRDLAHSLEILNEGGTIVFHDCNPLTLRYVDLNMSGSAWAAWAILRCSRPDLFMLVVDTDNGVGIIRRGRQELFNAKDDAAGLPCYFGHDYQFDWHFLETFRVPLLNLVSEAAFTEWLSNQTVQG